MNYLRVVREDDTHVDHIELPSENDKSETDTLNWQSIPDEVESEHDDIAEEEDQRSTISQPKEARNGIDLLMISKSIDQSKKGDSIGINSIFYSESASSLSHSKALDAEKDFIEICRELNDMAVELIKQGIQIQEGEDEAEGDQEDFEEQKMIKAYEWYQQAKSYLNACIKHSLNKYTKIENGYMIVIHYNLAWVFQKIPELDECAKHLEVVLHMVETLNTDNWIAELNKLRYLTKFHLQQWAIKSQLDNNIEALEDGKRSAKNWHKLISKTFTLCKSKIKQDLKSKFKKKLKIANREREQSSEGSCNEYSPKAAQNKKKFIHFDKSKYYQHDSSKIDFKKRRCFSEEDSKNKPLNRSTKIILKHQKGDSRNSSLENIHTFYMKSSPSVERLK